MVEGIQNYIIIQTNKADENDVGVHKEVQRVDAPVLIWLDYSMEELQSMGDGCIVHKHGQSSCTFLATAIHDSNYAWCPQLHAYDCPLFSAECYNFYAFNALSTFST